MVRSSLPQTQRGTHVGGSGQVEKANDRIVARRQKFRGRPWGVRTSDTLAAPASLPLNGGWEAYWHEWRFPLRLPLTPPDHDVGHAKNVFATDARTPALPKRRS